MAPRWALLACGLALGGSLAAPAVGAAAQPVPTAPVVLDGPTSDLGQPSGLGLSVARDGTGGAVYLKGPQGSQHVFVAPLVGGAFASPVQVDAGLGSSSASPVIAAGNGGLLLVAFISGGQLYTVSRASSGADFAPPTALASSAGPPSLSITQFNKAYLAFTVGDGSGSDVRAAFYNQGSWSLESAPLNVTPGDDAGSGGGRPAVTAAGDGVGIVAWGESGAIYSRRVWGTQPSVAYQRADGDIGPCTERSADSPVVGSGGDSSYAVVAFHEIVSCGGQDQSRVLMNRLRASTYDGLSQPDGLGGAASSDGAVDPQIAMGEYGRGFVVSQRTGSHDLYATTLGENGSWAGTAQVNGMALQQQATAIAATAGVFSGLIAWQQTPGGTGASEIRVRYAPDGTSLGPELELSSSVAGPTNAANGLAADGDVNGDAAVAWIQGSGSGSELVAARLYQPPGGFAALSPFQYQRSAEPALSWSAPKEAWGPVTYTITVDGAQVGQSTGTSLQLTAGLSDGPHTWEVTATNPASQTSTMKPATVFVDTVAPTVNLVVPAKVRLGHGLPVRVRYTDPPPAGAPGTAASGVAAVVIHWGDGSFTDLALGSHRASHRYVAARSYTITAVATDAAGNVGTAAQHVRISRPPPRRHSKPRRKGRHR